MPILRSISGLRATISDGALSAELVSRHVRAFAALQPDGVLVVGDDGRIGGGALRELVCEELCSVGRDVLDLGTVPTPTVQLIVEHARAAGGIVITASHNGQEWNGLKFLDSSGVFIAPERAQLLWSAADVNRLPRVQRRGRRTRHSDPIAEHLDALAHVPLVEDFRARGGIAGARIVLDAVNASGSRALVQLVEWLGGEPIALFCDGSGRFPHPPEPLPEHLGELCTETHVRGAALGLAVDPDADRLVLVHHTGQPISEEKTIVLAVEAVLRLHPGGTVVVNASTTAEVEYVAARYGGRVLRSAVGEINVVARMREAGAIIGGEGSGGVILPACHWGRDSLVGATLILSLWKTLDDHQWDHRVLEQPLLMKKRRIQLNGAFSTVQQCLRTSFSDAEHVWEEDGIRFSWHDRWIHIRPSNTEPIVRIIAESPDEDVTTALVARAEEVLSSACDG